KWSTLS
ncbi:HAMP domain protein, partial [Vibrio parahaemolyticus VP2007-007]